LWTILMFESWLEAQRGETVADAPLVELVG
jgi:hypothetical protein